MKIILYTVLALFAFAGNSVFCRLALGEDAIDAASFTAIRLLSGIVVLAVALKMTRPRGAVPSKGSWKASFLLFLYAITFSFAYISLETGTGALILFSSVKVTMILVGMLMGYRLYKAEWLGVIIAFFGFIYLMAPGLEAPSLVGFFLMSISGVSWGFYTLAGKGSSNPLSDTTYNFLRTLPLVIILIASTIKYSALSKDGVLLAMLSGGIASGIGYAIWYKALGGLSSVQAAVVQLLVPVIAGLGGVLFSNETLSVRLSISSVIILGGILTMTLGKYYYGQNISRKEK